MVLAGHPSLQPLGPGCGFCSFSPATRPQHPRALVCSAVPAAAAGLASPPAHGCSESEK